MSLDDIFHPPCTLINLICKLYSEQKKKEFNHVIVVGFLFIY